MFIRTIFIFTFVLFSLSVSLAQTHLALQKLTTFQDSINLALAGISFDKTGSLKEHNLYLNKAWQKSVLITKDDQTLHFSGRYNVLNNAIEMRLGEEIRFIYPRKIQVVYIGEDLLIPAQGSQFEKPSPNTYLQVLSFGEINLFVHHFLNSKTVGGDGLTQQITGQKKYFVDEALYFSQGYEAFLKLKSSKKKVLALFEGKSEPVAAFAERGRLKFNKKEDLTSIFDYFNGLR